MIVIPAIKEAAADYKSAVRAHQKMYQAKPAAPGSQEDRLRALEKRLEELQRIIERMERDRKRGGAGATSSKIKADDVNDD
jgi:hypothetical protein